MFYAHNGFMLVGQLHKLASLTIGFFRKKAVSLQKFRLYSVEYLKYAIIVSPSNTRLQWVIFANG